MNVNTASYHELVAYIHELEEDCCNNKKAIVELERARKALNNLKRNMKRTSQRKEEYSF